MCFFHSPLVVYIFKRVKLLLIFPHSRPPEHWNILCLMQGRGKRSSLFFSFCGKLRYWDEKSVCVSWFNFHRKSTSLIFSMFWRRTLCKFIIKRKPLNASLALIATLALFNGLKFVTHHFVLSYFWRKISCD